MFFTALLLLDYVDLLLIHTVRVDYGKDYKRLQEVWKGMEDVKQAGLAKSIGISNAGVPEIEVILKTATIVPAVNQVSLSGGSGFGFQRLIRPRLNFILISSKSEARLTSLTRNTEF